MRYTWKYQIGVTNTMLGNNRKGWYTKRSNLLVPALVGWAPLVQKGGVGKITTCEIQVEIHNGS